MFLEQMIICVNKMLWQNLEFHSDLIRCCVFLLCLLFANYLHSDLGRFRDEELIFDSSSGTHLSRMCSMFSLLLRTGCCWVLAMAYQGLIVVDGHLHLLQAFSE